MMLKNTEKFVHDLRGSIIAAFGCVVLNGENA